MAKVDTGAINTPYQIFAMSGMIARTYFAFVLNQAGSSIIGAQGMVKKIFFPRLIIPLSKAVVGFVDFGIAFLLMIVLLTGCSVRQLQVASTGLLLIDRQQTLQIAKQPDKYHETNPLLGRHPSTNRVNLHFGASIVANILVGEYVTPKYSKWYYYTFILLESAVIHLNFSIGLKF